MRDITPFHIKLRESWWIYPHYLMKLFSLFNTTVLKFRPYSLIAIISLIIAVMAAIVVWKFPAIEGLLRVSRSNYLIEAVVSPPVKINPLPNSSTPAPETQFSRDLNTLIFDPLVRVDNTGKVLPYLASNVTMLSDAKTISINIRKGVKWQDGVPFTIEDVQFTLDLIRQEGVGGVYFGAVDGVTVNVIDDYTLSFVLDVQNPAYIETLTWPVLPKHLLAGTDPMKLSSTSFAVSPIGTGPFVLDSLKDNQVVLSRNNEYWGEIAKLDGIIFYLFENADEALNALSAGQVHSFCYYDLRNSSFGVENRIAARFSAPLPKRTMVVFFNLRLGDLPVGDEEFRKALLYAIPKEKIIDEVLEAQGDISYGPIAQRSWAFNSSLDYYEYNIEKASNVLDAAGYKSVSESPYRQKDGVEASITLTYQEDSVRQQIVELIAKEWRSIGVNVTLREIPYKMGTGIDRVDNALYEMILPVRDFEALLFFQETPIDPDLYNQYYSTKVDYPGSNISGYSDIRTDKNLEDGRKTTDQVARKALYDLMQWRMMQAAPEAYLFNPHITYFVSNRVTGVDLTGLVVPEDRFLSVANWEV